MALTLATFNVKDFFDAIPMNDLSRRALDAKVANLAGIVQRADADVLALQEVGSANVLRELCARLPSGGGYREPVVGTADARGIRCALLTRLPIVESRIATAEHLPFPVFFEGDPAPFGSRIPLRRGVVHARLDAGAIGTLDVLVAHFKSNRAVPLKDARGEAIPPVTSAGFAEGNLRSLVWRAAEALFVRRLVDDLLLRDASANIAVTGDLNDHPGSIVLRTVMGGGVNALAPCAEVVPAERRFSILRHGAPQQIDHILVTPALRKRVQSARFLNEELRDHGDFDDGVPPAPDSDHAAFVVSFA